MVVTSSSTKPLTLFHLLRNYHISSALCFTKSVEAAHRLAKLIEYFENAYSTRQTEDDNMLSEDSQHEKFIAAEYSSELSQADKNAILRKFKSGSIRL